MIDKELIELTDEEIAIKIVQEKNPALFEIIYDRYAKKIYNKCLGFVKDRAIAQDLSHDILLRIYLGLASFSHKSKFSTWLFAITYNSCVDYHKKQTKAKGELQKYAEEGEVFFDQFEEESDEKLLSLQVNRLKGLVHLLPNEEKVVLLLKYQDDLSVKDIAQAMELSESAVKMRLKRGRDRLLKMYSDKYAHNVL